MKRQRLFWTVALFLGLTLPSLAQETIGPATGEALSLKAVDVGHLESFTISNSMIVTWIVALGLILFALSATRHMKAVPEGVQNFWEWVIESLYVFLESFMDGALVRKTFWLFATIFIFVLASSWFSLLPGVGSIGWGIATAHGFQLTKPLLRGNTADLNMTLAISMLFFFCWIVWAWQSQGPIGVVLHIFGPKGDTRGMLRILLIAVFIAVGFLEIVSILFRPVSLSLRLFGNMYAGEDMLEVMTRLMPSLSWVLPVPLYFMEVMVGFVQALVFMLLTAVFTLLVCQHEEQPVAAAH